MKPLNLLQITLTFIGLVILPAMKAQETMRYTENVLRFNIITPSIEYEFPVLQRSTITANLGIGMKGTYKRLAEDQSRPFYDYFMVTPYAEAVYKVFHNLEKRMVRNRYTGYNSGNYFGLRLLIRGPEVYSRFTRTGNLDFSYGPIWGLQRALGRAHFHFAMGPVYYFDTHGNSGFSLLLVDLTIGLNLSK